MTERWQETEMIVARYFTEHGWPSCERRGRGFEGRELIGMPGLAPEVKARRRLALPEWLRQADRERGGGLPFVIHRPDGFGAASIGIWPMTFMVKHGVALLLESGFGTEPDEYSSPIDSYLSLDTAAAARARKAV